LLCFCKLEYGLKVCDDFLVLAELVTCEHVEPGMKPLVVGDDEAGEEDDHHNDCAHHQANHSIVTLNEGNITGLTN
jgi:hypothetical protein